MLPISFILTLYSLISRTTSLRGPSILSYSSTIEPLFLSTRLQMSKEIRLYLIILIVLVGLIIVIDIVIAVVILVVIVVIGVSIGGVVLVAVLLAQVLVILLEIVVILVLIGLILICVVNGFRFKLGITLVLLLKIVDFWYKRAFFYVIDLDLV